MLSERSPQMSLYQADAEYLDRVGRDSFYGQLSQARSRLFRDEDFAALYCPDNGRPAVPPSLLAIALLLQAHDKVSDQEAIARANYDVRWCVALGIEVAIKPFVKSTLQLFRSQLLIHEQAGAIFQASLEEAKRNGFLRGKKRTIALDTTPIFGKGAVKDTYNLLATGIVMLARALAAAVEQEPAAWAAGHELARYFGSSIKGEAAINWDKSAERKALLASIVGDAQRLLTLAREALAELHPGDPAVEAIRQSAELLCQLLVQDIDGLDTAEPKLKDGVSKDRMPSATDPEMRHGRKSKSSRFDGHKATLAVDTETGLITDVDVIAGNAPDNENALELVTGTEENTGCEVAKTLGDCAYGDGATREKFADAKRELVARVPGRPEGQLSKDEFNIDLEGDCVTCPGGHTVQGSVSRKRKGQAARMFQFPAAVCAACPLRPQCVKGKHGRLLTIHPQEALLQRARAYEATDEFREDVIKRQVVEHRIARLAQLGIRKSRFFGRQKTRFQLLMASAVANLTLTWRRPAATDEGEAEAVVSDAEQVLTVLSVARSWLRSALAGAKKRLGSRVSPTAAAASAAYVAA
jgi:transposase